MHKAKPFDKMALYATIDRVQKRENRAPTTKEIGISRYKLREAERKGAIKRRHVELDNGQILCCWSHPLWRPHNLLIWFLVKLRRWLGFYRDEEKTTKECI